MNRSKLARARWSMGQVLMPAHFTAQEEALLAHLGVRFGLRGLPAHGVGRLAWDEALLARGALSVSELSVILPSGELIDVPGNAVVSNLNLGDALATDVEIYLHVLADTQDARGVELYKDDARELSRVIHRVALSTQSWLENARQSLKLAELRQDGDGAWRLSGAYVPPLLQVGTTPFLAAELASYGRTIDALQARLGEQMIDPYLGAEHAARLRQGAAAAWRLRALLHDVHGQAPHHPYHVFAALRDFYVDVCLLHGSVPEPELVAYDHDDLAGCFGELGRRVAVRLQGQATASPRVPFVRVEDRFVAGPLPEALRRAGDVYLLVQQNGRERVSLDGVKLASPGRLARVHLNALAGVPFRREAAADFAHTFGARAELYRLERNEEWEQAVREGALSFWARPDLTQVHAALTWRA
jgi:type VI secretion system protein ImpJ